MNRMRITKIGLIVVRDRRILLVRKRNSEHLILPGGKPNLGESDLACLIREIDEELGVEVDQGSIKPFCTCTGPAASEAAELVLVTYSGEIIGCSSPQSEIEEIIWTDIDSNRNDLSPLLKTEILPRLSRGNS